MIAKKKPPKRRKEVRKDHNLQLRLTEEQKATLSAAAEAAGVSLSSWVLMAALKASRKAEGSGPDE